jgi:hypothetical protein
MELFSAISSQDTRLNLPNNKEEVLKVNNNEKKSEEKSIIKPQILFEIWEGKEQTYTKLIEELRNTEKHDAFISNINGKLTWDLKRYNLKYLSAFVKTLITKKWISPNYSAPVFVTILSNTFNLDKFDSKPFKPVSLNSIEQKYLRAFNFISSN